MKLSTPSLGALGRRAKSAARVAFAFLFVAALSLANSVQSAFASEVGGGLDQGLETSEAGATMLGYVQEIVSFANGPFGIALCTIGLLIAVGGMIINSQRGQPWGKFGIAAVGVIAFFIVPALVDFLGQASGAAF